MLNFNTVLGWRFQLALRFPNYFWQHPFVKRHKLSSVARILKWQAILCFSRHLIPFPWINNSVLLIGHGFLFHGATFNCYVGLADFEEMGFLLHFLRAEDLFVDVGANIGSYTVLASAVSQARTIAVEPTAESVKILRRNILYNKMQERVRVFEICLAETSGTRSLCDRGGPRNYVMKEKTDKRSIPVEAKRMDDVVGSESPVLIKSDTEGSDYNVLCGAEKTLAKNSLKAVVVELGKQKKIHDLLLSNHFQLYTYDPFTRLLKVCDSYKRNNAIYLRDVEYVRKRLLNAPSFSVFNERI